MTTLSVFLIIAVISTTYSLLKENRFLNLINALIVFALALLVFKVFVLGVIGILLFTCSVLSFVFYISIKSPYNVIGNAAIIISSVCSSLGPLCRIMHWPGGNLFRMIGISAVFLGISWYLKAEEKDYTKLSPFILLVPFALVNFLQLAENWF